MSDEPRDRAYTAAFDITAMRCRSGAWLRKKNFFGGMVGITQQEITDEDGVKSIKVAARPLGYFPNDGLFDTARLRSGTTTVGTRAPGVFLGKDEKLVDIAVFAFEGSDRQSIAALKNLFQPTLETFTAKILAILEDKAANPVVLSEQLGNLIQEGLKLGGATATYGPLVGAFEAVVTELLKYLRQVRLLGPNQRAILGTAPTQHVFKTLGGGNIMPECFLTTSLGEEQRVVVHDGKRRKRQLEIWFRISISLPCCCELLSEQSLGFFWCKQRQSSVRLLFCLLLMLLLMFVSSGSAK
eukprot:m.20215 g.20215  ORF g.20215 m.20215 type:complete len:298 (+) comp6112_c0_seq1:2619-3512(+)